MKFSTEIAIISAELDSQPKARNKQRTEALFAHLNERGFNPVPVNGVYKGSVEQSFLVRLRNESDLLYLEDLAFTVFKQESILVQYSDGHSRLHYNDAIEYLGKLTELPVADALKLDSYSYVPSINKYYGVR